jgi:hypothetical protein
MTEDEVFLDFEAFDDDAAGRPIIVKNLLGRNWELPGIGELPADFTMKQSKLMIKAARHARSLGLDIHNEDPEKRDSLPQSVMLELAELMSDEEMYAALLGQDNLDQMRELGITERKLRKLITWVQQQHAKARSEEDEVDEDEDGPTVPVTKGRRSGRRTS